MQQVVVAGVWLPQDVYEVARWCHEHDVTADRGLAFEAFLGECIEGYVEGRA
jgi:hypothetical protein